MKQEFYRKKARKKFLNQWKSRDSKVNESSLKEYNSGFPYSQKMKRKVEYFNKIRQKFSKSQIDDEELNKTGKGSQTLHSKKNFIRYQIKKKLPKKKKGPNITNLVYPIDLNDFYDQQAIRQEKLNKP